MCHEKVFDLRDETKAGRYKEYSKELSEMVNYIIRLERNRIEIDTESTEKVSCYLVFNQIRRKEYIKAMIAEACCSKNELYVKDKVY